MATELLVFDDVRERTVSYVSRMYFDWGGVESAQGWGDVGRDLNRIQECDCGEFRFIRSDSDQLGNLLDGKPDDVTLALRGIRISAHSKQSPVFVHFNDPKMNHASGSFTVQVSKSDDMDSLINSPGDLFDLFDQAKEQE
ncbi:hypothetical protein FWF74_00635 [Candidatus Saccharibacteria bacterium]|nr:hypothetical protein [Candidatus Saccharibacteria bacterium]MCL1963315.1 hypothetical protein [Candidatus Saccharibacteria bacterium]